MAAQESSNRNTFSPVDSPSAVVAPFASENPPASTAPNANEVVQVQVQPNPNEAAQGEEDGKGGNIKTTSKWWGYFDRVTVGGLKKAQCKLCKKLLVGEPRHGTSHLKKHVQRCPKRNVLDLRQQLLQANLNKDKGFQISPFNFDQRNSRQELAKAIIKHGYSLSIVHHEGFKSFCNSLNPCFKMVCRKTIKKDCLNVFDLEKTATKKIMDKNEGRLAFTTDMWTSTHQKKGFMAITAHFIDNQWNLHSRIIRFIYVPAPHTSEALCEALVKCLLDWNLDRKLSSITVDNCSTNDAMMALLLEKLPTATDSLMLGGSMIHMRCCAHILNLIVKEGLKVIGGAIESIRSSCQFWLATPKRVEMFAETASQCNIVNGKKLILDCDTRWNSTYLMLDTAMGYKDVFYRLKRREPKYKNVPTEQDWEMTREICSRLNIFYRATNMFSGTQYPTANMFFPVICEIKIALNKWSVCGITTIELMALDMIEKFNKYWLDVNGLMGVVVVLDPRFKHEVLEFYFPKIYDKDSAHEVERILGLCRQLVVEYEEKEREEEQVNGVNGGCSEANDCQDTFGFEFHSYASSKKRKRPSRSELDAC